MTHSLVANEQAENNAGDQAENHPFAIGADTDDAAESRPGSVISLQGVSKVYRTGSLEVAALKDVSLQIDEGEYVSIMGPSGSGKSTLMHIIGCLDLLTAGTYRLAGEDVSTMDEIDLAEIRNRRIGFVFQQFHLLPSLSAWRNVELPLIYAGVRRADRKDRAIAALENVGLGSRIAHKPGELSGGQQQRVAVARALVSDPALVLADEPTGNLDSASTEEALQLFTDLNTAGRTIVLITHELEVAQHAARMVRVKDGLVQSDTLTPGAPTPRAVATGTATTATATGPAAAALGVAR